MLGLFCYQGRAQEWVMVGESQGLGCSFAQLPLANFGHLHLKLEASVSSSFTTVTSRSLLFVSFPGSVNSIMGL